MGQCIFLSSTCADLEDLRAVLKNSLEEMGYQVWASDRPGFPVDSSLHAQDNCLRNVERADQYVLIVNDRYGSAYDGRAYDRHPLAEDPKRSVSVTWYEYLRALACGKPMRILVRHGSANATTPELIASARPLFAIISVGSGNSFGLPRNEVLGRLAEAGARVYRTDLNGAVTFYLDGHTVTPSVAALQ